MIADSIGSGGRTQKKRLGVGPVAAGETGDDVLDHPAADDAVIRENDERGDRANCAGGLPTRVAESLEGSDRIPVRSPPDNELHE